MPFSKNSFVISVVQIPDGAIIKARDSLIAL
jgi:hypothetical protein